MMRSFLRMPWATPKEHTGCPNPVCGRRLWARLARPVAPPYMPTERQDRDKALSVAREIRRLTVPQFAARKGGEKLVCLTAYTAPIALLLDPHADMLLVGDSLGMVIYGYDSTLPVTLDQMIAHGAAVVRHSKQALVVVDMPF